MEEPSEQIITERLEHPRFWRVSRFWRQSCYLSGRFCSRTLSLVGPPVAGGYLLILDVWGDKWGWVEKNPGLHIWLFWIAIGVPLVVIFARGLRGPAKSIDSPDTAVLVLGDYIKSIGAIVEAKSIRFRDSIINLRPTSDKFKHITHPESQIRIISQAIAEFVIHNYGIRQDELDITIVKKRPSGAWHFAFALQNWKHAEPPQIASQPTAAADCLASGESIFYPDKLAAAHQKKYILSRRDKRHGDGSVFVYPVEVNVPGGTYQAVISIVTYKKQLCRAHEKQAIEFTKVLFDDLCRRYKLELYLDAIKHDC